LCSGRASLAEVALRLVLANEDVCAVLSGMSRMEHLEENVATASRAERLTDDEKTRLAQGLAEKRRPQKIEIAGRLKESHGTPG
jgi:predicted aldo/keto reductase-like oxidoreductase